MEHSFEAAVKQAFYEANVNHDCVFDFKMDSHVCAAVTIAQCVVSYKSGNEYIRFDILLSRIKAYGDITFFEFRGRGANDANQICIAMKIQGIDHQIIYLLP